MEEAASEGVHGRQGNRRYRSLKGRNLEGRADPGRPVWQNFAHRPGMVAHICNPALLLRGRKVEF